MGKGERCLWRSRSELPQEADEQAHHTFRQLQLGLGPAVGNQAQVSSDLEMAVKLSRRAQRNSETANELNCGPECVSFDHVGGHRHRRTTDLIRKRKVTTERRSQRESVCRAREFVRAFPRLEGCKLLHGSSMRPGLGEPATVALPAGSKARCTMLPFPFPHSRFPNA
jgi:hypothetical protein